MTGYGKAEAHIGTRKYTVEFDRSMERALDLSVRMPPQFREKRNGLAQRAWKGRGRGRRTFYPLRVRRGRRAAQVNATLVQQYVEQLNPVFEENGCPTAM